MADGEKIPVDPGLISRVQQGVRYIIRGRPPGDWFGPGAPPQPQAPESISGRQHDFGFGVNIFPRSKSIETRIGFNELRGLADAMDLVRLCIETRKDQIEKLPFSIQPKKPQGMLRRPRADARCAEIQTFLESPDKENDWPTWLRMLLEDMFVIDAATLFVRRRNDDRLFALEIVDGATISRVLDAWGRTPRTPFPAYQQVLKGVPAASYTTPVPYGEPLPDGMGELIYRPRNRRSNRIYGYSNVEQLLTTIQIALRSQLSTLAYFTEGNVPDALVGVPQDWDADKIRKFQTMFDELMSGDKIAKSRKMKFIPGGFDVTFTREPQLKSEFHEWLARVICYCFSLPPTAFVQQQNRATAQSAQEQAKQEGLAPLMLWIKSLIDTSIRTFWGYNDLEFVWDNEKDVDPPTQATIYTQYAAAGIMLADEVRAEIGLDPLPAAAASPPGALPVDPQAPMLPGPQSEPTPADAKVVPTQAPAQPAAQIEAHPEPTPEQQDLEDQADPAAPQPTGYNGQAIERQASWADQHRRLASWADKHRADLSWAGKFRDQNNGVG